MRLSVDLWWRRTKCRMFGHRRAGGSGFPGWCLRCWDLIK